MCRNIKALYNFDPPATTEEVRSAALQFVRKVSGFQKPSSVNQNAFDGAVAAISTDVQTLFDALKTESTSRNRDQEASKARERSVKRFGIQ